MKVWLVYILFKIRGNFFRARVSAFFVCFKSNCSVKQAFYRKTNYEKLGIFPKSVFIQLVVILEKKPFSFF